MAACRTYFISLNEVRRITPITKNVEDDKLLPSFNTAHDVLRKILGITMYDDFIVKIEADTLTSTEQDLIDDYICPFLSWETYQRSLPDLYISVTKAGMHTKSEEGQDSISVEQFWIKDKAAMSSAKDQQEFLIRHLQLNTETFTLFDEFDDEDQRINRTDRGIALGNRSTRHGRRRLDQFNEREL